MHDVTQPKQKEFGPIDELKQFTWIEFRRLSPKPEDAAKRLKQKLMLLKDESYILYINGLRALKESPLYLEYMEAVNESLKLRKSLAETLTLKNKIKMEEVEALVRMENEL